MNNDVNQGEILATGSYVGGMIGYFYGNSNAWDHYSTHYDANVYLNATDLSNTSDVTGASYVGGLFGFMQTDNGSSSVEKSSSKNCVLTASERFVGGLVGRANAVRIRECSNEGMTITVTQEYYDTSDTTYYAYLGGYVGLGYAITEVTNEVPIGYAFRGRFVGGVAGYLTCSGNNTSSCKNTADVFAPNASYVGGIAGNVDFQGDFTADTVENSGNITGVDYVGGIMGRCIDSLGNWGNSATYTVKYVTLVNKGDILATGSYAGGIVGYFYGNSNAWDHYSTHYDASIYLNASALDNTGDVTGTSYVGGLFGFAQTDNGSSAIVKSSSKNCAVLGTSRFVGGLAGRLNTVRLRDDSNEGMTVTLDGEYYDTDNSTYYAYLGGYVGYGYMIAELENAVKIDYANRGRFVGGIAGYLNCGGESMSACTNRADVLAPQASYVAGIVGEICYNYSSSFDRLLNTGNIRAKSDVGGIIGFLYNDMGNAGSTSAYSNSFSDVQNLGGYVYATENYAGGLFGSIYTNSNAFWHYSTYYDASVPVYVRNVITSAAVYGKKYVGGVVGSVRTDNSSSILEFFECTGPVYADGVPASKDTNVGSADSYAGVLVGSASYFSIGEGTTEGYSALALIIHYDGSEDHTITVPVDKSGDLTKYDEFLGMTKEEYIRSYLLSEDYAVFKGLKGEDTFGSTITYYGAGLTLSYSTALLDGATHLYPSYEYQQIIVYFESGSAGTIASGSAKAYYHYADPIFLPKIDALEGFTFLGWYQWLGNDREVMVSDGDTLLEGYEYLVTGETGYTFVEKSVSLNAKYRKEDA